MLRKIPMLGVAESLCTCTPKRPSNWVSNYSPNMVSVVSVYSVCDRMTVHVLQFSDNLHVQRVWQQTQVVDSRRYKTSRCFVLLNADWPSDFPAEHADCHYILIQPRMEECLTHFGSTLPL